MIKSLNQKVEVNMVNTPIGLSQINRLEVVLKTVERCNINCSYCYFFNDNDQSHLKHSKYISTETLEKTSEFLLRGIYDFQIKNLVIILHGGEPLLQNKKTFDAMCKLFKDRLGNKTSLSLSIQTNAILVDEEWIKLFEKHNISIGVSIDGPKAYNDKYRIDHKGRGTYDRLVLALEKLFTAAAENRIKKPAALSVINPSFSASRIYHHLVHELNFSILDFLLPDLTHITAAKTITSQIEKYLCELFNDWKADDNPSIHIRILDSVFKKLLTGTHPIESEIGKNQIISISTDGHVVPNDILRNTQFWDSRQEPTLFDFSLLDILNSSLFNFLRTAETTVPQACKTCCWSNICKGGELINRYNFENNFDNPSIYCSALKNLYSDVTAHLLNTGVSYDLISRNLDLNKNLNA